MDMLPAQADFDAIPVIDFASVASEDPAIRAAAASAVRDACTRVGFFYIRNHGVPQAIIDACFAEAREYFALPLEQKLRTLNTLSSHHRGFSPVRGQRTDVNGGVDLHEAFDMSHDVPEDDPEALRGCWLSGPNAWPDTASPRFRPALEAYYAAMLALGRRLFRSFALALDLPEDIFEPMLNRPGSFMRVLHYPPQPPRTETDADAKESLGIGTHSDYECFTILAQDDVGGLEVRNSRGEWVAATPIPGTFVINIGDMMARWTNDLFASTLHRVINRSGRERYSVPFFYGVDYDVTIETLPTCVTPQRPARYAPINAHDYVAARIKETYLVQEP